MNIKQEKARLENKAEQLAIKGKIKSPLTLFSLYLAIQKINTTDDVRTVEREIQEATE